MADERRVLDVAALSAVESDLSALEEQRSGLHAATLRAPSGSGGCTRPRVWRC